MFRLLFPLALALALFGTTSAAQTERPAQQKGPANAAVVDAAQRGDVAALTAALETGGRPDATDANGAGALLWAAGNGHRAAVRVLLEAGAAIEGQTGVVWLDEARGLYMSSPLVAAAAFGHAAIVSLLIDAGDADPDAPAWNPYAEAFAGRTALQWATVMGQAAVVDTLLARGADPDAAPDGTLVPLALAQQRDLGAVADALEAAGADPETARLHLPTPLDGTATGVLTDQHPRRLNGARYAAYTLDRPDAAPFEVVLAADGFDPFLFVFAPSGALLSDDNWLGALDTARVVVGEGEPGTWTVQASAFDATGAGAYRLTTRALDPAQAARLKAAAAAIARADSLAGAALALEDARRYAEAASLVEEETVLRANVQGPDHASLAPRWSALARLYEAAGRYAEAEPLLRRALATEEQARGPDHPHVATTLNNLAVVLEALGRYDEALPLHRRALALRERTYGPDAPETASSLGNLAALYQALARPEDALPLAERALATREAARARADSADELAEAGGGVALALNNLAAVHGALGDYARAEALYRRATDAYRTYLGADHPDRALALGGLADALATLGRYSEAETAYREAVALLERGYGEAHPVTATGYNNLAAFYKQQGRYDEARPFYRRAVDALAEALGPDHPDVATALGNRAALDQAAGRYAAAEDGFHDALARFEAALGPDHPATATALNNLAGLLELRGRYAEAEPLYRRALAIREAALGADHPDMAGSLGNLAGLYTRLGRYAEAEPRYRRALDVTEAAYGPAHPAVAVALGNLAAFFQLQGRYAEAEVRFERALRVYEAALGPDHPDVATGLNNLAALYAEQGRLDDAAPLYERALAIHAATFGDAHPDVALSLSNLGALDARRGRFAEAAERAQRALAIRTDTFGPDHPDTATSLGNLAVYLDALGRTDEAEAMHRRALAATEAAFGPEHPDVALYLNNLADHLRTQGRVAEARPLAERALAVRTEALGPTHPTVALTLATLADLAVAQGRLADADARLRAALAIEQAVIDEMLPYATEREQQAFLRTRMPVDLLTSAALLPDTAAAAARQETAFAHLLQRKALRLDVRAAQLRAIQDARPPGDATPGDATAARLLARSQALAQQLAQRTFAGPGDLDPDAYRAQLDTLRLRRERIEDRLARVSATSVERSVSLPAGGEVAAVAAALAPTDVVVEYVRFRPYDFAAVGDAPLWQPARYAAFILDADAALRLVDVGPAATVDSLVERFRTQVDAPLRMGRAQLRRAQAALAATTSALHARLIEPLALPATTTTLLVAPDAALHTLPFEVLTDAEGAYLTDKRRVSYRTSGRDLLRPPRPAVSDTLVVFAAVDYGAAPPEGPARAGAFAALHGTAAEADALAALVGPERTQTFLGADATEGRLLGLRTPGRLHIATHGFFLDAEAPALADARSGTLSGPPSGAPPGDPADRFADPLLRSGLALAGANQGGLPGSTPEHGAAEGGTAEGGAADLGRADGIATAYELVGLDLRGTDLVTLSACETGLGEVEAGEGVLGLRRAFEVAGAATVVLSLWKVPDDATAALMTAFYRALDAGRGKAEALREAAQTVRATPRWAHPYWWGAFVLAGDAD